jgi:hypothetical protein
MWLSNRKGTIDYVLQTETGCSKSHLCESTTLMNKKRLDLYIVRTNAESQLTPTQQSPPSKANIHWAGQEMFRLSHDTKIHYRIHNGQQLVNIPSHPNSVHILHPISLTAFFFNLPSTRMSWC